MPRPNNLQIAEMLDQVAELLEIKQADAFRVAAYRRLHALFLKHANRYGRFL